MQFRRKQDMRSAFRLLVWMQFAAPPLLRMEDGQIVLPSVSKVARLLSVESKHINQRLVWLEEQGYITNLSYGEGKRSCRMRLRAPTNATGASI